MTRAWRLARIVGSRGGVVYAWARRPGVLRMWEVALESGAVVSARAAGGRQRATSRKGGGR